tara:strand:+ start:144 stop:1034 length:891 start_codon:yes stop_codon:yes gene_type:complete
MKIGRNDQCPCGSGKKYKKCCMNKFDSLHKRSKLWDKDEVEKQSSEEILETLNFFGVKTSLTDFNTLTGQYYSAEDLSEHWFEKYPLDLSSINEDYLWFAAWVLWERDSNAMQICDERIDELIEKGYETMEEPESSSVKLWTDAWEAIKSRYMSKNSIETYEESFKGDMSLFNWCQDFEELLYNHGLYKEWNQYCCELVERFRESDESLIKNILKSLGESYFILGDKNSGDRVFKELITDYPKWTWGYIGWSDMYASFRPNKNIEENKDMVKQLLEEAEQIAVEDFEKEAIRERLH